MKTMFLGVAVGAALLGGCEAESSPRATDDVSVQTAFYGLTVLDCQQQATQCFSENSGWRLFRRPVDCSLKLTSCLTSASVEVANNVVEEAADVTSCGSSGVACFRGARTLKSVLSCEASVESCVLETVNDLTGIPLPTSQQVANAAVSAAAEVIDATTEVAEEVVETAVGVTGEVIEHAVETTGQAAETALAVGAETVDTAVAITEDVLQATAATGVKVVTGALQCAEESQTCIRTTRKLLSCQLAYAKCLSTR